MKGEFESRNKELLPCPMCGDEGDPEICEALIKRGAEYDGFYVRCGNCGLNILAHEYTGRILLPTKNDIVSRVILEWNTRKYKADTMFV